MARRSPTDSRPKSPDADSLEEMRTRYDRAREVTDTAYQEARADIEFVTKPGAQWDEKLKARRGNRPTYEFPKLQGHVRQVVNEMRQSRPQGKVRGTEETDVGLAEIMQGIARNIESVSNAEQAYDIAFEQAVKGGLGHWRICTDYANEDDFELDIRIKSVRNFASVKFDPAAVEIDRRDALYCFVEELISRDEFKRLYPDADLADFDDNGAVQKWRDANQIRVAEYWYKQPVKRVMWAITGPSGDKVVFQDELPGETPETLAAQGYRIVKERTVKSHKIMMRLTNGHEYLTEPYEFPSKFIPVIPVWGNIENIDGVDYWQGMVRSSKDMQRLHNVHRTAMVEAIAKAPKAPFVTKPKYIKGFEQQWYAANAEDRPVLFVTDETPDGAMPVRTQQAEVPVALIQAAQLDNEDIKASTGQFNPSLGAQSNASSGRAINSLKMAGATATYNYLDNLIAAIRYQYEILVDMIPRVYDTRRVVRLLGEDGGVKWKTLYEEVMGPNGPVKLNDISKGKYDVTVTVGPAFATQRMEAAEAFTQLAGQIGPAFPQIAPLLAYQAVNNTDLPGSDDVAKALRKILVGMQLLEPKEGEEAPGPQQPNPADLAKLRELVAKAEKAEAEAQKAGAEAQVTVPKAQSDIANTDANTRATELDTALKGMSVMPMPAAPMEFMG